MLIIRSKSDLIEFFDHEATRFEAGSTKAKSSADREINRRVCVELRLLRDYINSADIAIRPTRAMQPKRRGKVPA